MAQFRATIQGGKGQASRLGHKTSGLTTTASGWTAGVRVEARHLIPSDASGKDKERDAHDIFGVYENGGSNGTGGQGLIAEIADKIGGKEVRHYLPGGRLIICKNEKIISDSAAPAVEAAPERVTCHNCALATDVDPSGECEHCGEKYTD